MVESADRNCVLTLSEEISWDELHDSRLTGRRWIYDLGKKIFFCLDRMMWQVYLCISENISTLMENKWRLMHSCLKCPLFLVPCSFSGFVYPLEVFCRKEAFYKQSLLFILMNPFKMLQIVLCLQRINHLTKRGGFIFLIAIKYSRVWKLARCFLSTSKGYSLSGTFSASLNKRYDF